MYGSTLVLGRLRTVFRPLGDMLGTYLGRLGVTPNWLTALGVVTALLAPLVGYLGAAYLIPLMIVVSAVLDWLDGAVARATSRVSKLGSFVDSVCDRVSDTAYLVSLHSLGVNVYAVLAAIPLSLLVSYVRCRAESLGIGLEGVGYVERGERVVAVLAASVAAVSVGTTVAEYILLALIAFSALTIIQRLAYVIRVLQ